MMRHRLRTGRWWTVHPGVIALLGVELTPLVRIHAAVLAAGDDAVASHSTAAALFGIPGYRRDAAPLHVTAPSYTARRRTPARVHGTLALPAHHRRVIAGVPATSVARTVFDLCAMPQVGRAERALDNVLARRWVTIPALWRVLDDVGARGRSGTGRLRRMLLARGSRRVAPESELEARFIDLVRSRGLPEPARQVELGDGDQWIGRVDFVYRSARVVIECDGRLAHSSDLDRRADAERDRRLRQSGWRVARFTWDDVTGRPAAVADSIRSLLEQEVAA
jgi:very-short-patch-repair endonuclease